jgi:AcrR family transcriptional regulator
MRDGFPTETRQREVTRISPSRIPPPRGERERMLQAVLAVSGEIGYEQTTIADVIAQAGTSRAAFYRHFNDKEDCFIQAYGDLSGWVYARLAGAARRRPEPRQALAAAIAEALEMCAEQPAYAKALIVEPLAAGGRVREEQDRLLDRLSDGLDRARGDLPAELSPVPSTASFIVGAIASVLRARLIAGEADRVQEMLPGVLHLMNVLHLGEEPATGAMAVVQPLG